MSPSMLPLLTYHWSEQLQRDFSRRLELTSGHDCRSKTQAGHKPEFAVQLLLVAQVLEYPGVILVGLLIRGYLAALAMVHLVLIHVAQVSGLKPEDCEQTTRMQDYNSGQGEAVFKKIYTYRVPRHVSRPTRRHPERKVEGIQSNRRQDIGQICYTRISSSVPCATRVKRATSVMEKRRNHSPAHELLGYALHWV